MKNLAIIPARSGSKGIKDKNIRELNGKPLIYYSIRQALESEMFDTVMLSTDSEKYGEIGRNSGAEVPFLRSEKTSSDKASSWDVVAEVLEKYKEIGKRFDTFMLLQPTSPLRTADDIRKAYKELEEKEAESVISLCETDSPFQCNTLPGDLSMDLFISQKAKGKRRQDMEKYYKFNGAIYLTHVDFFEKDHNIYRDKCFAYIMDKLNSIDIDDESDFELAEALLFLREKNIH
jgi:CMP-N,N'-diacetyllegionaminic acid synthase